MRLSPSGGRKIENFWKRTDAGNGRRGRRWQRSHGLVERDGILEEEMGCEERRDAGRGRA